MLEKELARRSLFEMSWRRPNAIPSSIRELRLMLTSSIWSLISRHVRNFRCGALSLRKIHSRQNCSSSFCWIWKFYIDDIISQNGHQGVLERPRRQHQQEKDGKSGMSRVKSIRSEEGDQIGMQLQYSSQKEKIGTSPNLKHTLPMNNHLHVLGYGRMRFTKRNQRPFEPQKCAIQHNAHS